MSTFGDLVNDVFLLMEGYGLDQGRSAFLVGAPLTTTGLSFTVDSTINLSEGLAEIDDELIYVQFINDQTSTVTIAPDGRGYRGTAAATHAVNARITMSPVLPRAVVKRKINETIVGVYPTLFGQATTMLTTNPTRVGYDLPEDVDQIVSITFQELGPSRIWTPVRRWNLDHNADTTEFPTGKALNIHEGTGQSSTVRVVYLKQPSELVNMTDDLTLSGLRSTARAVVVAGAAWRLVSFMDASRLKVSSASIDQTNNQNPIGTATQVGSFLRKQYERELADELARQQLATPPLIHWTE